MMETAKSLQRVAKELGKNGHETLEADLWLFQGKFLAVPILLSLATEIALKAWRCTEEKAPARTHNLLKLFKALKPSTQDILEAGMRKRSPHSVWAEEPSLQNLNPHLEDMLAARRRPLRSVLCSHSNAFQRWRYLYEQQSFSKFETAEIDRALTVLIDAFNERRKSSVH